MKRKAELYEDGWCTFKTTFSEDERVFMVLKYTETGNAQETIKMFQRQFPNPRTCANKH